MQDTLFDEKVAKMILLVLGTLGGPLLTCANMVECSHEEGPGQGFPGEAKNGASTTQALACLGS